MSLSRRGDRRDQFTRPRTIRARAVLVLLAATTILVAATALGVGDAMAVPRHPFAIAGNESGAGPCGMFGWLFAPEVFFKKQVDAAVRAATHDGAAVWLLVAISAVYGVLHAAGPGHGKAVVAAYMVANERALRRGLIISFLAALLQGIVAVAIVATAVFVLGIPLIRTRSTTEVIEIASFAGVALLGAWLTWRKGRNLLRAWRDARAHQYLGAHPHGSRASVGAAAVDDRMVANAPSRLGSEPARHQEHAHHEHAHHEHAHDQHVHDPHAHHGHAHVQHVHDANCGHFHAPDPRQLGDGFSWGSAALTVGVAGARPCAGALVVLAFSLQQGIFTIGILAVFAMSVGTAVTTGALATMAVMSKGLALRFFGRDTPRGVLTARGLEFAAAAVVLLVGLGLLLGSWGMAACG